LALLWFPLAKVSAMEVLFIIIPILGGESTWKPSRQTKERTGKCQNGWQLDHHQNFG
jgi:hypothetical protein